MNKRMFPIQSPYWMRNVDQRSIPWESIAPHEEQAKRNHGGQTIARLAERGGLGPNEAICVLLDKPYEGPTFSLPRDKEAYQKWDAERWEILLNMTIATHHPA
jgi:hypothetical protein